MGFCTDCDDNWLSVAKGQSIHLALNLKSDMHQRDTGSELKRSPLQAASSGWAEGKRRITHSKL